jgi:hypothetical protein
MVQREVDLSRKPRRSYLQARLKAKNNYITKKRESYWIMREKGHTE